MNGWASPRNVRIGVAILIALGVLAAVWFAYDRLFSSSRDLTMLPAPVVDSVTRELTRTSPPATEPQVPAASATAAPAEATPSTATPPPVTNPQLKILIKDTGGKGVEGIEARLSEGSGIEGTRIGDSDPDGVVVFGRGCDHQQFVAVPPASKGYRSSGPQPCNGPELALVITDAAIVQNYILRLTTGEGNNDHAEVAFVANELAEFERQRRHVDAANAYAAKALTATGAILEVQRPLSTVMQDGREVQVMSLELQRALIRLQRRQGLEANGVLGRDTIMVLRPH